MKWSSLLKSLLPFIFSGLIASSYSQPGSKIELNGELYQVKQLILDLKDQIQKIEAVKKSLASSLELKSDDNSGARIVYTKPERGNHAPDIQMIAIESSLNSVISHMIRIEIFTREGFINLDRIHIRSISKKYEFKLSKDYSEKDSENYGLLLSRCWCNRDMAGLEGYTYTFQLAFSEEDFFHIISSKGIKVGFSSMLIPEKEVSIGDMNKMNELHAYLTARRNIETVILQLMDAIDRFHEIKGLLNYM